jgi:hypothetical protein
MRIIAFITDPSTIRDILLHVGEPTAPPRIAPAPEYEFDQRIAW